MSKTAVVTGGGSGVGRAIALKLAAQGWRVIILGRRAEALNETTQLAGVHASRIAHHVCDIGDASAVADMGKRVLSEHSEVHLLVNAAGTNAPRRALEVLSPEDYHAMIATNLNGPYYCVQAFLPPMRARKSGLIVNIVSDAAKQASAKAGPGRPDAKHQRRRAAQRDSRLRNSTRRHRYAIARQTTCSARCHRARKDAARRGRSRLRAVLHQSTRACRRRRNARASSLAQYQAS